MEYLDFDLIVEAGDTKGVSRVVNSPVGSGSAQFVVPFSDQDLEIFILRIGRTRSGIRRIDSPEMRAAREFGHNLYEAVFADEVGRLFERSLDEASREGKGLRLRLRVSDTSTLYEVPWEFIYSEALGRFLVLSAETPLVRYVDLPQRVQPLAVAPPLRVLVVVSSPADFAPLDVHGEVALLQKVTRQLQVDQRIRMHVLEGATFEALRKRLKTGTGGPDATPFHVLHFIGHGGFDKETGHGALLFEDVHKRGRLVTGHDLGVIVHDHPTLRLVVLNACEGARAARPEPFGGVAQSLLRQGIPAVIAMQFEVTDGAAKVFAEELYLGLCDGRGIDAASVEARRAIFTSDNDVEWATPVLYLRSPDGALFDLSTVPADASEVPPRLPSSGGGDFQVGTPVRDPRCFFGRYKEVRRLLQSLRVPPLQNAAIVGAKRSGKTSLLRHLHDVTTAHVEDLRPEQRRYVREGFEQHRWVYADFQDPRVQTRAGLLRHLLGATGCQVPEEDLDLDRFFGLMVDRLDRPTVVLLDEVGVALQRLAHEFDDAFWDAMRSLASYAGRGDLAFVLALHAPPHEIAMKNDYTSPFFNIIGYTANLGPFSDEEAHELIGSSPIRIPPGDVDWIIEQSGRWPILLQILCSERLSTMQEGDYSEAWREAAISQLAPHAHLLAGAGRS